MLNPQIMLRNDRPRNDGSCCVVLQVYGDGKRKRFPLDVYVLPVDWNGQKCRVLKSCKDFQTFNSVILEAESKADKIIQKYLYIERDLSLNDFEREFKGNADINDFLQFFEENIYEQYQRQIFHERTLKVHKNSLRQLRTFAETQLKQKTILFSEISVEMFAKFDLWLCGEMEKSGFLGKAARHIAQKSVKKFLEIAKERKIKFENPFPKGSRIKQTPEPRTYLNECELRSLLALHRSENEFLSETHRIVLVNFLFSCFTGLRFSDVQNIVGSNIVGNTLVFVPIKTKNTTGKQLNIELTKVANELLDYSKKFPHKRKVDKYKTVRIFGQISNQKANDYLKRLAKMASISKDISTHTGRHTFATIFLEKGGDVQVLKNLMGHQDINTTMIYVHILAKTEKQQILSAFDGF